MMTEDELRDRLRSESAGVMPPGDLIETLANGHARRQRRARAGLIGGSLAATALVVALVSSLVTGNASLQVDPATLSPAEIIQKARDADAAAQGMIMNFKTDYGSPNHKGDPKLSGPTESWALRSEKSARIVRDGVMDDIVRPDFREQINHLTKKVIRQNTPVDVDVVSSVSGSASGDPGRAILDDAVKVVEVDKEIHLTGLTYQHPMDIWLDPKTFLPKRAKVGALTMTYTWLPASAENRKKLEHTVPPDYQRETFDPKAPGTPGDDPGKILTGAGDSVSTITPPTK